MGSKLVEFKGQMEMPFMQEHRAKEKYLNNCEGSINRIFYELGENRRVLYKIAGLILLELPDVQIMCTQQVKLRELQKELEAIGLPPEHHYMLSNTRQLGHIWGDLSSLGHSTGLTYNHVQEAVIGH